MVGIIGAIFRHRRLMLYVFFGTVLLTLVLTLLWKKQYASHMKVFVQNTRELDATGAAKNTALSSARNASDDDPG